MPKFPYSYKQNFLLYLAWIQSVLATLGSLFFSEVLQLVPCKLCWFQRILMYPLSIIIAVGILRKDRQIHYYVLPLSLLGLLIALYHNLLYYGIINKYLQTCSLDVPCTKVQFTWFGFLSIPLLSLIAFTVITVSMFLYKSNSHNLK